MNQERQRRRAEERLLTAEIAEVLGVDTAAIEAVETAPLPRRGAWLAAALVCLGVVVAGGVAWLRAHDDRAAAQGAFDPADPWWEHEARFRVPLVVVTSPEEVAALPAAEDRITVSVPAMKEATIEAVLRRAGLRQMLLVGGAPAPCPIPWALLTSHGALSSVGFLAVPVDGTRLRELRTLPQLRGLTISHGSVRIDAATAAALAELTRLRHLNIAYDEVDAEALAQLAGLPELDTLVLGVAPGKPADLAAQFAAVARIGTLRALIVDGDFEPMEADALRHLRSLARLVALQITNFAIDDAGLAALPRTLQHLTLPALDSATPDGLARLTGLGSLRSLGFHHRLAEGHEAAVCMMLPKLPLACFDYPNAAPSEALWSVLAGLPLLRRLQVCVARGEDPTALFLRSLACRKLEVLFVSVPAIPSPQQLAGLREHPTLRRIVLRRYLPEVGLPTAAELAALRASVRAEVEVR